MIPLLLASLATAGPTAQELSLFAAAGVQAMPDAYGDTHLRAVQELGAEVPLSENMHISAMGAYREGALRSEGDLYRLSFRYHAAHWTLHAGRVVRVDSRGWLRLDGLIFDDRRDKPLTFSLWAGQLWHPASWSTGHTVVGGVEAHLAPRSMAGKRLDVGYEAQVGDKPLTHRLHATGTSVGAKGGRTTAHVEAGIPCALVDGSGRTGLRAVVDGHAPVGTSLDLGGDLRWEGLPPPWAPEGIRTPMDWLAPDGYAAAGVRAAWRQGDVRATLAGGPTVRPVEEDTHLGGRARLALSWQQSDSLSLGAFATAAAMDASGFAGGGVQAVLHTESLELDASAGVFEFQPLDGHALPVWEARARAEAPLIHKPAGEGLARELGLAAEVAAGTDRLLAPWVRAGVAVHGRLGSSYWGRP